ncbi:uncharacterized protein LOC143007549 [Genypterus blacodes]|uniref:uncharacterized protein LOC143007549 n=1 Tax=Genypterus blacodes TaxID=154954 RepID=UPI003F76246B
MDFDDHAYTYTTYDHGSQVEFIFKLGPKETEEFVKLRVTNNALFSGKRNTAKWAWRAILKHMGLHHKMTHVQASKKWDNLKKKYKELKNPPQGVKVFPETWPYYNLMDDAMEGRLDGTASLLKPLTNNQDACDFLPVIKAKRKRVSEISSTSPVTVQTDRAEMEVSLNGDEEDEVGQEGSLEIDRIMEDVEDERALMANERQVMKREKQLMERERQVLQRERVALDRETAALDRDRASLERERATIEREKAVMERERVMLERDRETLNKDRATLDRDKAFLEILTVSKERTEGVAEDSCERTDSKVTDRKERFLKLFEKLIENL